MVWYHYVFKIIIVFYFMIILIRNSLIMNNNAIFFRFISCTDLDLNSNTEPPLPLIIYYRAIDN